MARRVVVTGLGVVCPIGTTLKEAWSELLAGTCGISVLTGKEYEKLPCRVAGLIQHFRPEEKFTQSELKTMAPATSLALAAAEEALKDANWSPTDDIALQQTGVAIGMGMVDLVDICKTHDDLRTKGYKKVSPYFVPRILPNMAAGQISIKYGFKGPNHAVSTACATGAHAIGDAYRFISNSDADVMVCGGAESCISPLAIAGFCRLRALSTSFNNSPIEASRPFDKNRDGFVMGEGSAILVLEELEHALKRGANIHAEILGYGLSGDASHLTAPSENGLGATLAMSRAIKNANIKLEDVGYINAHATSTPLGDAIEATAIRNLFASHVENLQVSSTKGSHGHLLGAAGNLESVFTIMACQSGQVPPTLNLHTVEENVKLNYVANVCQSWKHLDRKGRRVAIKNSFGFGGTNASLCIAQYKS